MIRAIPAALVFALVTAGAAMAQTGPATPTRPDIGAPPGSPDNPAPIEAVGQGAQDPARSEFLEGWSKDMPRCLDTLIARRETEAEAHTVCTKILTDLDD